MKTLYFECSMGASGDMVNSSLLELLDCPEEFIDSLDNFNLEGINIKVSKATKCGVTGTNFDVLVNGAGELSLDVDTDGGHSHGLEEGDRHGLYHNHTHGQEHSHNHEHSHYDFKNITDTIN
ncbi:MAG: LarC family nickel insertion protein, partial [Clostridiales bacterium]|nr:LarC family nickel insertion protein [Clostridiales bacterium]